MKIRSLLPITIGWLCLFNFSCAKESAVSNPTCEIFTGVEIVSADGAVTYQVTTTKNATLESITYSTHEGLVILRSPGTSLTQIENIKAGDRVSIAVTGYANQGKIMASYHFPHAENPKTGEDECGSGD